MAKKVQRKKTSKVKKISVEKVTERVVASSKKSGNKFVFKAVIFVVGVSLLGFLFFKFFLVASVNGKLINRFAVVRELEKQGGRNVTRSLILKSLINQEAKKRKITVSKKELDAEIKRVEANAEAQGATLDLLLKQQGVSRKELEEQLTLQLLVSKMIDNKVDVSDKEVEEYLAYDQNATKEQAKEAVKQGKLQDRMTSFLTNLETNAKIKYFFQY
ncbi:hypothetical protein B6D29_00435 [Microgenomates bacterium UTCPR1]|nr:SurA N-terminal domain-containing protein [Patescibacteria group bacterium]OQY68710.1 MAG: hypothetical protein B6D29_00435 [Microgenomates bacterium UTCPR1]